MSSSKTNLCRFLCVVFALWMYYEDGMKDNGYTAVSRFFFAVAIQVTAAKKSYWSKKPFANKLQLKTFKTADRRTAHLVIHTKSFRCEIFAF